MEQRKLYISDLHFEHINVTRSGTRNFDNRPFLDCDEMRDKIIDKWNAEVTKADHVYILGDFWWKLNDSNFQLFKDTMNQLNGNKHLITGNHDRVSSKRFCSFFEEVVPYKEEVDIVNGEPRSVIMSHYYIPFYNQHFRNAIMLHGHSHISSESAMERRITKMLNNQGYKCEIYNVGCMYPYIDYAPRTLQYIVDNYSEPKNESDEFNDIIQALLQYHSDHPKQSFMDAIYNSALKPITDINISGMVHRQSRPQNEV